MSGGYSVVTAVGRVVAGQTDNIWTPRTPRPGKCGVILVHGSGAPQASMDLVAQPASVRMAAAIADAGIPCIAGDFHYNAWANNNLMTAITNAWTVLKGQFPAMRTDKVILVGGSMGGGGAARWSQLNPTKTAGVVGLIPAYNVKYEYQNISGVVPDIETAWGFSGIGSFPTALDLASSASAAVGIPHLTAYASNDPIVPPTGVLAYTSIVGGTVLNVGALGHSDAAIGAVPLTTLIQFLAACGA